MFEDSEKKAIEMMMDKYINDMSSKCKDEIYTVFELINKEYKETGECLIHKSNFYHYNETRVATTDDYFIIDNEPVQLVINANYCPICGKKLGE